MGIDDLPRDAEAKARMRAKRFILGPEGMKSVKYCFIQILGNARALILNIDMDVTTRPRDPYLDLTALRAERLGIAQ